MSNFQKIGWITFLVILLLLGSFIFGRCSAPKQVIVTGKTSKADTTYKPLVISGAKFNVDSAKASWFKYWNKYVKIANPLKNKDIGNDSSLAQQPDSIEVLPFEVCLDTIINKDTFKLMFFYPANMFSLDFKLKPITIQEKLIKVTETITLEKSEAWYIKPAIFLTGGLLGYVAGRIQK